MSSTSEKETKKAAPATGPKGDAAAFNEYRIPASHSWAGLWKVWAAVTVLGLIMSVIGGMNHENHERFAFSYLTAVAYGLTLALGGWFFVLIQHATRSGWSVIVRRGAEHLMATLPLFAVLVIPIWVFRETLYPWLGEQAHEPGIVVKSGFLNSNFWTVRMVIYVAVWTFMSLRFLNLSRKQDETGDPTITLKLEGLSFPGIPLFALTLTFAGFDWLMSLEPEWYSTMFGVYVFAGAAISVFAFIALLYSRMAANKLVKGLKPDHFWDVGKMFFGFTVFWAYISFSQYFLQWYANIPEETVFFLHRQDHGWGSVSILIVLGHFFFPFFLLLSRHSKTFSPTLQLGAIWVLFMHYVDMYWLVMPNVDHEFAFSIMDLGPLLLVVGAMMTLMFKRMATMAIVPLKDPRLDRSLAFENA